MIITDCPTEYVLELNMYTDHVDSSTYFDYNLGERVKYNEKNNVIALGLRCKDYTLGLTSFKNSYYEQSYMLSLEYNIYSTKDLKLDLGIGIIDGYDKKYVYDKLFINDNIMAAPMVSIGYKTEKLKFNNTQITPKIRFLGTAVLLNVELSF